MICASVRDDQAQKLAHISRRTSSSAARRHSCRSQSIYRPIQRRGGRESALSIAARLRERFLR